MYTNITTKFTSYISKKRQNYQMNLVILPNKLSKNISFLAGNFGGGCKVPVQISMSTVANIVEVQDKQYVKMGTF